MNAQAPQACLSGSEGCLNSAEVEAQAEALRQQLKARRAARLRTIQDMSCAAQVWFKLRCVYGKRCSFFGFLVLLPQSMPLRELHLDSDVVMPLHLI